MKPIELKKLIKTMRENGVLKLKAEGLEIELAPESLFPEKPADKKAADEKIGNIKAEKQYSDLEIALWSSALPGEPLMEEQ